MKRNSNPQKMRRKNEDGRIPANRKTMFGRRSRSMVKKPGKDLEDVGCLLVGKRGGTMAHLSLGRGQVLFAFNTFLLTPLPTHVVW